MLTLSKWQCTYSTYNVREKKGLKKYSHYCAEFVMKEQLEGVMWKIVGVLKKMYGLNTVTAIYNIFTY